MIVAERKFVIDAPQEGIWELLGDAIFSSIRLERMQIIDENNFAGVVRVRIGFISLPMHLRIKLVDISSPRSLTAKVIARTKPGIFTITEETRITLTLISEGKTEVGTKAAVEEMGTLPRLLLLWKIRSFAEDILDGIKRCLEKWLAIRKKND